MYLFLTTFDFLTQIKCCYIKKAVTLYAGSGAICFLNFLLVYNDPRTITIQVTLIIGMAKIFTLLVKLCHNFSILEVIGKNLEDQELLFPYSFIR